MATEFLGPAWHVGLLSMPALTLQDKPVFSAPQASPTVVQDLVCVFFSPYLALIADIQFTLSLICFVLGHFHGSIQR